MDSLVPRVAFSMAGGGTTLVHSSWLVCEPLQGLNPLSPSLVMMARSATGRVEAVEGMSPSRLEDVT